MMNCMVLTSSFCHSQPWRSLSSAESDKVRVQVRCSTHTRVCIVSYSLSAFAAGTWCLPSRLVTDALCNQPRTARWYSSVSVWGFFYLNGLVQIEVEREYVRLIKWQALQFVCNLVSNRRFTVVRWLSAKQTKQRIYGSWGVVLPNWNPKSSAKLSITCHWSWHTNRASSSSLSDCIFGGRVDSRTFWPSWWLPVARTLSWFSQFIDTV